ncbi:MAG: YIP1 family protein [Oscillospiraceae bacterium]|nr:YIP1 family protein [Oscillospiraceae bacterium]
MKKRTGFDTMSPYLYPFYICRHPRDGFLELKANKKGSPTVVLITVALWLMVELFFRVATGYDMNQFDAADTSLLRTAVVTVMMFVMVCLSNWCICTLMDGKGKLMDICVVAANALVPYIIVRFITTMFSWVLAGDEQVFLTYAVVVSEIWGAMIAFSGLQEIHEYSVLKTIYAIVLTVVCLIIMFFIALMLLILFEQLYSFIVTLVFDLRY